MSIELQIRRDIEGRIRSGQWRPGDRIPFEHELVKKYGCARATVSKALGALAKAGLIERRRKAGSFVAQPHFQTTVLDIPDIGAVIAQRGETYQYRLLRRRTLAEPSREDAAGPLKARGPLLLLVGIHFASKRPFCFERRRIDLAAAPAAADIDFASQNPGAWLLTHEPWTDARHQISAVGASVESASALGVAVGAPCLEIERWTWRMRRGITHVTQTFPGEAYNLVAEFTPKGS